jgi:DNA helicase-2/ATP-dependent DNA helicase PcrA
MTASSIQGSLDEPPVSPELVEGLNDAQRQAVLATEGPTLIVAGAGSGKTRVLTHRIAHLIRDHRVPPPAILAITFTNKAAKEMQERLQRLVSNSVKAMWVSTFHSACVRILRRSGSVLGYGSNFTIYDESDAERLMTAVCRDLDFDPKRLPPRQIRHAVSNAKNQLFGPDQFADRAMGWFEKKVAEAYKLYQRRLHEANALDFDDLIMQVVELLANHPEVRDEYQRRFRYVLVDEFQDTNVAQYELLKLLTAEHRNLSVVGDGDQSIYAFRGATVRNILDFESDYPDAKVILLEQNYRSTQTILSAANAVIANNAERKPKNLWTSLGDGDPITRFTADDEHSEASFVATEIERLRSQGYAYGDMVVFYRTNAQSRVLEEVFVKAGMPYKVVGGVKFYDRREVKDLLAYLKATVNPLDTVSLKRVLNVPRRGIGDTSERLVDRFADEEGIPFGEALRRAGEIPGLGNRQGKGIANFVAILDELRQMAEPPQAGEGEEQAPPATPSEMVQAAWTLSSLMRELEADTSIEGQGRVENVRELDSVAEEYGRAEPEGGLSGFLESIALVSDADEVEAAEQVTLMTLHTAKGLEFPVVFLTGMEENVFPHSRSISEPSELEEERRLAYVGLTRAKRRLYLLNAWSRSLFGGTNYNLPSRFLKEVPDELVSVVEGSRNTGSGGGGWAGGWSSVRPTGARAGRWDNDGPAFGAGRRPTRETTGRPAAAAPATVTRPAATAGTPAVNLNLAAGEDVIHASWGRGRVITVSGEGDKARAEVDFPKLGRKTLLLRYAPLSRP